MAKQDLQKIQEAYMFYKQTSKQIKAKFTPNDLRILLEIETDYSPYLNAQLLRLMDEFEMSEDYEFCQVIHEYLNK